MAEFVEVKEIFDPGRTAGLNESGARQLVRFFSVETVSPTTNGIEVTKAPGIPRWGSPYLGQDGQYLGAVVVGIQARANRSPNLWIVEVRYGTAKKSGGAGGAGGGDGGGAGGGGSGGGDYGLKGFGLPGDSGGGGSGSGSSNSPSSGSLTLVENPLLRLPSIRWTTSKATRPVEVDVWGTPIVNGAGLPYDPPIEREESYPVLTITRNLAVFDANWLGHVGRVNQGYWLGQPNARWRLASLEAERKFEQGIWFWEVTASFEHRHDTWILSVMNAGTWCLDASGTKYSRCVDKNGNPASKPVPLATDGKQLAVGGTINYDDYDIYEYANFDELGLI